MNLRDKKNIIKKLQNLINDGEKLSPEFSHQMLEENCHTQLSHEISDQDFPEELLEFSDHEISSFCSQCEKINDPMNQTSSERHPEEPLGWFKLGPW